MDGEIIRGVSEEDLQLEQKRLELFALEAKLAQRELELATFQAELDAFEHHYFQLVGMRQQELDRIEAQILDYIATLETTQEFAPSASLKQLYRDLAKQIHPDLATDPKERARRESLMAEVNRAYAAGDIERIQTIFDDWQKSPESIRGDNTAAELMRTIRKIDQSQSRLRAIEEQILILENSDLHQLWTQSQTAKKRGQDLLNTMANQLEKQIQQAQLRLNDLKQRVQ